MAATSGSIVGMTTNVDECRQVYDNWANNYEKDVNEWGYNMPDEVASLLNKHLSTDKQDRDDLTILDAGAGDGLSGLSLMLAPLAGVSTPKSLAQMHKETSN